MLTCELCFAHEELQAHKELCKYKDRILLLKDREAERHSRGKEKDIILIESRNGEYGSKHKRLYLKSHIAFLTINIFELKANKL